MKLVCYFILGYLLIPFSVRAQYPPSVGNRGCTAIHKDSSAIIAWANKIEVIRGLQDIANPNSDTTSVGAWHHGLNAADGLVVSLGDRGEATLQFKGRIYNGAGPDFVVFENAFNSSFLELAFVEVSSDGIHFFRFPAHSLTDTSQAVGSFGEVRATDINNLAGKYQLNYGTPFDLEELKNTAGLDIMSISHVKLIDVVGTLNSNFATRDTANNKINDQYPTPFTSGGFDLDAVGVLYMNAVSVEELEIDFQKISIYPNPIQNHRIIIPEKWILSDYYIFNSKGQIIEQGTISTTNLTINTPHSGIYHLKIVGENKGGYAKLIVE